MQTIVLTIQLVTLYSLICLATCYDGFHLHVHVYILWHGHVNLKRRFSQLVL